MKESIVIIDEHSEKNEILDISYQRNILLFEFKDVYLLNNGMDKKYICIHVDEKDLENKIFKILLSELDYYYFIENNIELDSLEINEEITFGHSIHYGKENYLTSIRTLNFKKKEKVF